MRILVTGGSGFIGSHIVDQLLSDGHQVRIFDMVYPTWHKAPNVEFYHGSLLDPEAIRMAANVDAILHLGAMANVNDVIADPILSERINVQGTISVLEAARKSSTAKKVVYASTIWVYSDTCPQNGQEYLDEDTNLSLPSHLYTATKLAGENYCRSYHEHYGLDYSIVRYGIPYGPRARTGTVINIFVDKALKGEDISIMGDGSQYRKFVYVEDLAKGTVLALQNQAKNETFNLEGDEKVTIRQLAELVQSELNPEIQINYAPSRGADFAGAEISNAKAKNVLGWSPSTSFEVGFDQYVKWYKDNQSFS